MLKYNQNESFNSKEDLSSQFSFCKEWEMMVEYEVGQSGVGQGGEEWMGYKVWWTGEEGGNGVPRR